MTSAPPLQLGPQELASSLTHGFGLAFSAAGSGGLIALATIFGNTGHVVACSVYSVTLVFLYAASTLYHSARSPRLRLVLRDVDHIAIMFLIAGTYTPFALLVSSQGWRWAILATVWCGAVGGATARAVGGRRFAKAQVPFYILLGWSGVVFAGPLLAAIPRGGLVWLLAGGVAYTGGVAFYRWRSLPFNHAIWHLFVLAGSTCHYLAVLLYVLPDAAG